MASAAKKEAPSIAVLFGGKPKPKGDDEYAKEEGDEEGASVEEYRAHLSKAFPDEDWSDDKRVTAMKDFVMACMP